MGLKDIKLGKSIDEIQEGDSLTVTEIHRRQRYFAVSWVDE